MKKTAFWDIVACSLIEGDRRFRGANFPHHQIVLMMEAANIPETSVSIYENTRPSFPEGSLLPFPYAFYVTEHPYSSRINAQS
jgi:hypothetical protein